MKRFFIITLIGILTFSLALPVLASPSFITSENGLINITSPIDDDTYIAGSQISIDRDIQGDLFIGAGDVIINSTISGDVFVGSGTVKISGNVGDDLRIGGGQVIISGDVGDDVLIGTGTLIITEDSVIRGDLLVGAGSLEMNGKVFGNTKMSFGTGIINGVIEGDVNLEYEDTLAFGENAKILGKLAYWAPQEQLDFENVAGSVEYYKLNKDWKGAKMGTFSLLIPGVAFGTLALKYLGLLLLGGLLILFLPKYLPRIINITKKNYLSCIWQGFVFAILIPILTLISAVTLIGVPLSFVIMLLYILIVVLSGIIASVTVGSLLVKPGKDKSKQFWSLAVGAAIYTLLVIIPVIGWIIKLILVFLGVGAIWKDTSSIIKAGKY